MLRGIMITNIDFLYYTAVHTWANVILLYHHCFPSTIATLFDLSRVCHMIQYILHVAMLADWPS